MLSNKVKRVIAATTMLSIVVGNTMPAMATTQNTEGIVDFKILGTTDLHSNLMNYDYYNGKYVDDYGLSKVVTALNEVKAEMNVPSNDEGIDNFILLDNGDTIQGSALGDYYKMNPLSEGHPVYKTMDYIGFDVANLGNHEFNYGLDYLKKAVQGLDDMSIINSNIYDQEGNHMFAPYEIIEETVLDNNGVKRDIKIGVVGVAPTQINVWDRVILDSQLVIEDMVEATKKTVDELRSQHDVDLVVALAHSGYGDEEYQINEENVGYEITKIDGIDAFIAGHTHEVFPSEKSRYNSMENVNPENGIMNGKPTIMAGRWGSNLGVIDLKLKQSANGSWEVLESKTHNRNVTELESDKDVEAFVKEFHENADKYVNESIGSIDKDMNTFFALVKDNPVTELVAKIQKDYFVNGIESGQITELEEYKDLPILSLAAAFRAGVNAIDIPKGEISIKDATSLYQYSNTIALVKLTGAEIKDILEMCASVYNKIDPNITEAQQLINDKFIPFNYDVIEGIEYEIDVTKDVKYNEKGELINPESSRIVNLRFNGEPLDLEQEFLVATNSYRAGGGGNFPHLTTGDKLVYTSDKEVREVIIEYFRQNNECEISSNNNWSIKMDDLLEANVVFTSNVKGANYLVDGLTLVENIDENTALYRITKSESISNMQHYIKFGFGSALIVLIGLLCLVKNKRK